MESNEAMKAMARRIASEMKVGAAVEQMLDGLWDNSPVVQAALAAIMETQEACAKLVERDTHVFDPQTKIAAAIRAGEHYALAGGCGRG